MKHFINLPLILILAVFSTSCSVFFPYQVPKEIEEAQEAFDNSSKRGVDDIVLDPIEQIPDTSEKKLFSLDFTPRPVGNWGYNYLKIDKVQDKINKGEINKPGRRVHVFIHDTSGEYEHFDLKPIQGKGQVFTGEQSAIGTNGHSPHVAGIVGATSSGGKEIGIALPVRKEGLLTVYPYKVLKNSGSGSYSAIINATDYATTLAKSIIAANEVAKVLLESGEFVIYNYSLGGGVSSSLDRALADAKRIGVLLVAATGNNSREGVSFPGSSDNTLGIGSITTNGKRSSFSNYGTGTVFAAPGSGIRSTHLGTNGYTTYSGTSMATPQIAGCFALAASIFTDANATQLVNHFARYSSGGGKWSKELGYGVPDMVKILTTPISDDQPEQPDEEPDDEPAEPKPDPGFPSTQYEFTIPKTYSSLWRTMSDDQMKTLEFTVSLKYKVDKDLTGAAVKAGQIADGYFRNRFLMLPDGSTELNAAYWTKYFFKLIEGKKGNDIEVSKMTLNINGVLYEYNKVAPRKVNEDCPLRKGAITYQY